MSAYEIATDMVTRPKAIVPIIGEPDIDESYIRQQDDVVLKTLLIDRTMTALNGGAEVNIKWAVDDYAKEYPDRTGYGCEDQISIDAISSGDGKDLKVVTPRVKKRKEEQERRTAQKAEVFTPSWICNEQNNLVDEAWFGGALPKLFRGTFCRWTASSSSCRTRAQTGSLHAAV